MSSAATSIALLVETTPALVFSDPQKAEELFAHIEQEVAAFEPDLSSDKGRKAVASFAYKISRTKTAIDEAGAALIEEANKKVKSVNAERKRMRDHLDGLRDKARKPLDDWEAEQATRRRECEAVIDAFKAAGQVTIDDTAETLRARISEVQNTALELDFLGDFFDTAKDAQTAALASLNGALTRQIQIDDERAELDRLRQEQRDRDERDRIDRETREAAQRQAQYISDQIQHIVDCGRGFIGGKPYPLPVLQRELEEKVTIDESFGDRRAEAETALAEASKSLDQAEARQREQDAAEQARRNEQAEADARRREEEAAQRTRDEAAAQKRADEDAAAARAADQEHRADVTRAAKEAIMATAGIGEDKAKKIVLAIGAGNIPHISIRF